MLHLNKSTVLSGGLCNHWLTGQWLTHGLEELGIKPSTLGLMYATCSISWATAVMMMMMSTSSDLQWPHADMRTLSYRALIHIIMDPFTAFGSTCTCSLRAHSTMRKACTYTCTLRLHCSKHSYDWLHSPLPAKSYSVQSVYYSLAWISNVGEAVRVQAGE